MQSYDRSNVTPKRFVIPFLTIARNTSPKRAKLTKPLLSDSFYAPSDKQRSSNDLAFGLKAMSISNWITFSHQTTPMTRQPQLGLQLWKHRHFTRSSHTRGRRHFRQAADTPFITGPVAEKIGPFDDNKYCNAILHGTFDFTDLELELEVADLIRGMQYPDPANPTCHQSISSSMTKRFEMPSIIPGNVPPHPHLVVTMDTTGPCYVPPRFSVALPHSRTFAFDGV